MTLIAEVTGNASVYGVTEDGRQSFTIVEVVNDWIIDHFVALDLHDDHFAVVPLEQEIWVVGTDGF